ncbi:putative p-loop containing nucleoside triphosphate hydrolase [Erysiphe neolycopersici]|uniref:Putative p-loop containing nucleoside triphosphate hydrolase n=1 Tax=Erysiphe neolycopersici TaxID=212602 RepID=A0A420HTR1_9PEZI|nr:putative p-loop containing nucleoside triphosphate hydrolase [Erysiphe neolycopersici]
MATTKGQPEQTSAMKEESSNVTAPINFLQFPLNLDMKFDSFKFAPCIRQNSVVTTTQVRRDSIDESPTSLTSTLFSEFLTPRSVSDSIFSSFGGKKPNQDKEHTGKVEGKINNSEEEKFLFVNRFSTPAKMSPGPPISRFAIHPKRVEISEEERLFQAHLELLKSSISNVDDTETSAAPVFSASVLKKHKKSFQQYGFFAGISSILEKNQRDSTLDDPRLFFNISSPSSAFICGSQGSGKSHTLSCLLENCLMRSDLSNLKNPLSALVLHYDEFTSNSRGTPCEAAYLASNPDIKVRVLCSPTNLETIKRTYAALNVTIEPLHINQTDLNTKRMLDLMAVNTEDGPMPLYLHSINRILRELRLQQQTNDTQFNYSEFKSKVMSSGLTATQLAPLNQRLDTLESFMPKSQTTQNAWSRQNLLSKSQERGNEWTIKGGTLTIVDLSCPCVTSEGACALFNMCVGLFLEQDTKIGRIVALDEAHKYMNSTVEASTLTSTLLTSIRLQRHNGTRVFISTQEPTISPALLDLCSITIVHRFSSPEWLRCLRQHIAALNHDQLDFEEVDFDVTTKVNGDFRSMTQKQILAQIVKLDVGGALLFAPSAMIGSEKLGIGYLHIKVRNRVSADGGKSIMAV